MRRYLEKSRERETNVRACVRACVGGGVEGQDRSDGGERKENDAWALWFWSAGRPLLTQHLQAQQRRGPSVFRHRGARGAGAPARGAHSPCALTRSRSGRCRCRTPERYHSVRSVTFRVRVACRAFGTVFLERYATLCNSANAGQNAALLFTPCFTRETLFSTKCVANALFSTLF